MTAIIVRQVSTRADIRNWIAVPYRVFAEFPNWVPRLTHLERRRISPAHNPFFGFAEAGLFVCYRDGEPVGRISAQVNSRYLRQHQDQTGHFGFFETVDDPAVSTALLAAAAEWLAARGMARMLGPFSLSINEECGLLVDGFSEASMIMMPYAAPWQSRLLQQAGFTAEMDLYAFRLDPAKPHAMADWLAQSASGEASLTVRPFDTKTLAAEFDAVVDIFNDAWKANWGFVPLSRDELDYMFGDLKPFFRSHYGKFVCKDGRPVAFALAVPNIDEIVADFRGRLFPFNWARLVYSLGLQRFRSGRLPLIGIRSGFHGPVQGAQILAVLMKSAIEDTRRHDLDWIELAWIVASNAPVVKFLRSTVGEPAKTYRIYSRGIGPGAAPIASGAA